MDVREKTKALQAEFAAKGDAFGWFEALYQEAEGDNTQIPWADLEPNRFFVEFARKTDLQGHGRRALVVGCGLGDDARYLDELGFQVTAFDISDTAVKWARRLHSETPIHFESADLFAPPPEWLEAFDFVLEIYTIQPLPLGMRPEVIKSISKFVAPDGRLVVVTRGREDDEEPSELPWPLSRRDLSNFEKNGFRQTFFEEMFDDEEPPVRRFVVEYHR